MYSVIGQQNAQEEIRYMLFEINKRFNQTIETLCRRKYSLEKAVKSRLPF